MVAISFFNGIEVYYDNVDNTWRYWDTKKVCKEWDNRTSEKCDILPCPDHIKHERKNKESICIDKGIVNVIKELWKYKIITLGSCDGHDKYKPNIIIGNNYDDIAISNIKKIISSIDKREFEILQWRLIEV